MAEALVQIFCSYAAENKVDILRPAALLKGQTTALVRNVCRRYVGRTCPLYLPAGCPVFRPLCTLTVRNGRYCGYCYRAPRSRLTD